MDTLGTSESQNPSAATIPSGAATASDALIFDWGKKRLRGRSRLTLFLFLSLLVHIAFFYVLKVVYPEAQRTLPSQAEIFLLHPSNPLAVPVINHIVDREAAFRSSINGQGVASAGIDGFSVTYRPTFVGRSAALAEWDVAATEEILPPLFPRGEITLPLPDVTASPRPFVSSAIEESTRGMKEGGGKTSAEERQGDNSIESRPWMTFGGALAERALVARSEGAALTEGWSAGGGQAVFMIGVARDGRVVHSVAVDRRDLPDVTEATRFLQGLRFVPDPSLTKDPVQWGRITLRW